MTFVLNKRNNATNGRLGLALWGLQSSTLSGLPIFERPTSLPASSPLETADDFRPAISRVNQRFLKMILNE